VVGSTGVAVPFASAPSPLPFTARTSNVCSVPFLSMSTVTPVSSANDSPASGPSGTSAHSDHVASPSLLTRYWYFVTALPPSSAGYAHDNATDPPPGVNDRLPTTPGTPSLSAMVTVALQSAPPSVEVHALPSGSTMCIRKDVPETLLTYNSNVSSGSSAESSVIANVTCFRASNTAPDSVKSAAAIVTVSETAVKSVPVNAPSTTAWLDNNTRIAWFGFGSPAAVRATNSTFVAASPSFIVYDALPNRTVTAGSNTTISVLAEPGVPTLYPSPVSTVAVNDPVVVAPPWNQNRAIVTSAVDDNAANVAF